MGRGLGAVVAVVALGLLVAGSASARVSATALRSSRTAKACRVHGSVRVGHFSGIVRAQPVDATCAAVKTSDAANGTPPLIWHGGPVMGTHLTGPVVVTPIFWHPADHPMASAYRNLLTQYLTDVAAASGTTTNVFSTLNEYYGSTGAIHYQVRVGTPINDSNPLPKSGCGLKAKDARGIYADGSGYDSCLDDNQVIAETQSEVTAHHLPIDYSHLYVMYLPKHVESCFYAGTTAGKQNACTINYEASATYCAYHNYAPSGMVYANMPFPVYNSAAGFTCGTEVNFGSIQSPNGNPDADVEISPSSHETMESITDPDTVTGWYDTSGYENGDECAYVFGPTKGAPGKLYNQVINGHQYLTQEEFSNRDFTKTGLGCLQSEG
jgi:hypothetical protein